MKKSMICGFARGKSVVMLISINLLGSLFKPNSFTLQLASYIRSLLFTAEANNIQLTVRNGHKHIISSSVDEMTSNSQ